MDMQYQGDSIAPYLYNEFNELEEKVEELFPENDAVNVLEGLIESKQNAEQISPEDLAWVDSCLLVDPEFSLESWASIKEALLDSILLDSITAFATSYEENNAAGIDEDEARNEEHMELDEEPEIVNDQTDTAHTRTMETTTEGDHDSDDNREVEIVSIKKDFEPWESIFKVGNLREEEKNELISELKRSVAENNAASIDEDKAGYGEPEIVNDQRDIAHVRTRENATEGDHDTDDDGEVVGKKDFESRESIFKVWDLREEEDNDPIPELKRSVADFRLVEEEDDWFITELNRAVAESMTRDKQRLPINDVDIAEDGKLNELISSMGDLSLEPLF